MRVDSETVLFRLLVPVVPLALSSTRERRKLIAIGMIRGSSTSPASKLVNRTSRSPPALVPVLLLKSLGMARYMQKNVPGMDIPDDVIDRLKGVPKDQQAQEGINICVETIEHLKEIEGVKGFHIMAIEWEAATRPIVEGAGLLPRPTVGV